MVETPAITKDSDVRVPKKKQNVGTKKYKELLTVSHQPSTITLGMISPSL
jgi:hypothetical protein